MRNFSRTDNEIGIVLVILVISCINRIGLLFATICLLYYFSQGMDGCIKALMLIAIRTPFNTVLAVPIGGLQSLKWIEIFAFCGYLFCGYRFVFQKYQRILGNVTVALIAFIFIAIMGSLFNASYPITAVFKLVSYFIAMEAIMIGVMSSYQPQKYIYFFTKIMTPIMVVSFFTIGISSLRVVNLSFQGVFNHPNMMGIMGAVYICFYILYRKFYNRGNIIFIIMALVMIYFAESRTGMASAVLTLILGYKSIISEKYRRYSLLIMIVAVIGIVCSWNSVTTITNEFIFKHDSTELFSSREGQIENYQAKFSAHPLLGSGFAVPYDPIIKDYSLNTALQVEPGNLAWAVIGDCGIIGTALFGLYLLCIFLGTYEVKWGKIILYVVPLLVSMGEMAFFSVNSIAPLYYLMLSLYMVDLEDDLGEVAKVREDD